MDSTEPIRAGQVAPAFNLQGTKGRPVSLWDFKQRRNLVIYFFDGGREECRQALSGFAEDYFRLRALDAEMLGVTTAGMPRLKELVATLDLPFQLLSDRDGKTAAAYRVGGAPGIITPAVFVLDRYNAVEKVWRLDGALPDREDILATLELVQWRCPE